MKKLFSKKPILLLVAMLLTAVGVTSTPSVASADPPWILPTVNSSNNSSLR